MLAPPHPVSPPPSPDAKDALYRRVALRVFPLLFASYVAAYLNRMNVSFAKLQMVSDLRFSDTVYGLGSGVFFVGYLLFEVPSNLVLHRVGARMWIARIMVTWSLLSGATMFVHSPAQFYVLRFFLGAAEAGFFPGMILYLTYWFPSRVRVRVMASLITGISVSGGIGGPLSGWILRDMDATLGLAGWRWLFVIEALPTLVLGLATLAWLPSSVREARWLSDDEKASIEADIAAEAGGKDHPSLARLFSSGRVWGLCLVYFLLMVGLAGLSFWMPQILRNAGAGSVFQVGLYSAVPYVAAAAFAVVMGRHSDHTGERFLHLLGCVAAAVAGFTIVLVSGDQMALALLGLSLAAGGVIGSLPLFWMYPPAFLGGVAAAAGIALINSVGNLGGFVCPYVVGALNDATHRQGPGIAFIVATQVAALVLGFAQLRRART
jgi:MFS family permease